jgi:hypothetical protein
VLETVLKVVSERGRGEEEPKGKHGISPEQLISPKDINGGGL